MATIKCWQVDAFTHRAFGGNSAAICWLEHDAPHDWMQSVAAEMNLSETAFVRRQGDEYELRWFAPQVEVSLCGHATLAAAHVLWNAGFHSPKESIRFQTQSGMLTCKQSHGFIEMDFPASPVQQISPPANLLTALGVSATYVGRSQFDFLVVVKDADTVRSLTPDFRLLKDVLNRGVMVTSLSDDSQFDFISRFFAPTVGIDEDPVTGSAHCCLAPYWSDVLGKTELTALQASSRGGVVQTRTVGDRVVLGGGCNRTSARVSWPTKAGFFCGFGHLSISKIAKMPILRSPDFTVVLYNGVCNTSISSEKPPGFRRSIFTRLPKTGAEVRLHPLVDKL